MLVCVTVCECPSTAVTGDFFGLMSTLVRGAAARMFIGEPLSQQMNGTSRSKAHAFLNEHLRALRTHIANFYPLDDRELETALADIDAVCMLLDDGPGLAAKRALLLFGIYLEDSVALGVANGDDENDCAFAEDLVVRILPIVAPEMVRTMGQFPHSMTRAMTIFHVMWSNEDLSALESA